MGRNAYRPEIEYPAPRETGSSPAPPIMVECWCLAVERMSRPALDRFTRDIWRRFAHEDLEPLKAAILRRRRVLAGQLRP